MQQLKQTIVTTIKTFEQISKDSLVRLIFLIMASLVIISVVEVAGLSNRKLNLISRSIEEPEINEYLAALEIENVMNRAEIMDMNTSLMTRGDIIRKERELIIMYGGVEQYKYETYTSSSSRTNPSNLSIIKDLESNLLQAYLQIETSIVGL